MIHSEPIRIIGMMRNARTCRAREGRVRRHRTAGRGRPRWRPPSWPGTKSGFQQLAVASSPADFFKIARGYKEVRRLRRDAERRGVSRAEGALEGVGGWLTHAGFLKADVVNTGPTAGRHSSSGLERSPRAVSPATPCKTRQRCMDRNSLLHHNADECPLSRDYLTFPDRLI